MIKYISIILLLFLFEYGLFAQTEIEKDSLLKSFEIGLDMVSTLDKSYDGPQTIFMRYNFSRSTDKIEAIRFRFGLRANINDSAQISLNLNKENIFESYIRIGYERQHLLIKKIYYYYGGDLTYQFYRNKFIRTISSPTGPMYFQGKNKTQIFVFTALGGIRYSFLPWLSLSAEISLDFNYRVRHDYDKLTPIDYPDVDGVRGLVNVKDFNIDVFPVSHINLCILIPFN